MVEIDMVQSEKQLYLKTASQVRRQEVGDILKLNGWFGGLTDCKVEPPCLYCRLAFHGAEVLRRRNSPRNR